MTDDPYSFWRRALAITGGKRSLTRDEMKALVVTEEPCAGFWRRRTIKAGPLVPVAIWKSGLGDWVAVQSGTIADAEQVWTYCAPHPVTHEAYSTRMETGRWPDEDEGVTDSFGLPPAGPTLGDNNAPEETPLEALERQITAAAANLDAYKTIGTDEDAGKAQAVRSRLLDLGGQADVIREKEKAPHLAAERAVDKLWMPLVKSAKENAETLRTALKAYETAKLNKAKAEALALAKANEEAAKAAAAANRPAPPPPAPEPPPVQTTLRGASGRAATVKMVKQATVTDYIAFLAFVLAQAGTTARQDLVTLADKAAQRAINVGMEPPGVSVEEVADVR